MTARVLFVSVNQTFKPGFTLSQLEPWVASAWALTASKAETCDRVVAIFRGAPIGCWRLRGAYPTVGSWGPADHRRPRIALSLGEALPVLPEYAMAPVLRRGSATSELPGVDPLDPEHDALPHDELKDGTEQ